MTIRRLRSQLTTGEDVVDPETFAGSIPQARGIAPRLRVGRDRWFNTLWLVPLAFVGLVVSVAIAQGLRNVPGVQHFIETNPGTIITPSARDDAGFPAWVAVQHFFTLFLMIFITSRCSSPRPSRSSPGSACRRRSRRASSA